jgi:pimeloyl-ACP methyl ester carboxylesterase
MLRSLPGPALWKFSWTYSSTYANNVKLYPTFHKYFREWKPLLLAIWGRHDPYFTPAGAEAFRRDNLNATVQFLETGHFALETHLEEIASSMKGGLAR